MLRTDFHLLQTRVPKPFAPAIAAAAAAESLSMADWVRRALRQELLASGYGKFLATGSGGATSPLETGKAA
jgi:hypothetical protein